ncbi:unnamed protein product [Vitrella brassicaformis CCMP3155]|uniref:Kinesin motor domain-containing protein n=1 Tax=Vitrella brassicaformis (strain CCMP3155) TaxID=1169540 RepID=A0A0G4GG63_VITBC|nr:unnamed protein product [Vitrella brassicaformis CCMP3155]|eukprot:CEM28354.1 unnamed protein product [Vitrella brassicaformis CCMP3155]
MERRKTTAGSEIQVMLRFRPPDDPLSFERLFKISPEDRNSVSIVDPAHPSPVRKEARCQYTFNKVFLPQANQHEVFVDVAKPLVDHMLSGFNSCCFAYGQTGGGKTYSIFGEGNGERRGILPRAIEYLFERLEKKARQQELGMVVSFLEIYLDQVRDLGRAYLHKKETEEAPASQRASIGGAKSRPKTPQSAPWRNTSLTESSMRRATVAAPPPTTTPDDTALSTGRPRMSEAAVMDAGGARDFFDGYETQNLTIHESPSGQVYVKGLNLIPVRNIAQVLDIVNCGVQMRATYETRLNANSSRSHTIFAINVVQRDQRNPDRDVLSGTMNLVDLAGSERIAKSKSEGRRFQEAVIINTSLSALGKVVLALAQDSRTARHIPYRDSKLTRILQNSLGGNSYTSLLTCLYPIEDNYEECLNSLAFADRCKNIRNRPTVNYVDQQQSAQERQVRELTEQIESLKNALQQNKHAIRQGVLDLPPSRFEGLYTALMSRSDLDDTEPPPDDIEPPREKRKEVLEGALGPSPTLAAYETLPAEGKHALQKDFLRSRNVRSLLSFLHSNAIRDIHKETERCRVADQKAEELNEMVERLAQEHHDKVSEMRTRLVGHEGEKKSLRQRVASQVMQHERELRHMQETVDSNIQRTLKHTQRHLTIAGGQEDSLRACLRECLHMAKEEGEAVRGTLEAHDEDMMATKLNRLTHHNKDMQAMRDECEALLESRKKEVESFVSDVAAYEERKDGELRAGREHLLHLLEGCNHLCRLIQDCEAGVYPVSVKRGVRSYVIPASHKPQWLIAQLTQPQPPLDTQYVPSPPPSTQQMPPTTAQPLKRMGTDEFFEGVESTAAVPSAATIRKVPSLRQLSSFCRSASKTLDKTAYQEAEGPEAEEDDEMWDSYNPEDVSPTTVAETSADGAADASPVEQQQPEWNAQSFLDTHVVNPPPATRVDLADSGWERTLRRMSVDQLREAAVKLWELVEQQAASGPLDRTERRKSLVEDQLTSKETQAYIRRLEQERDAEKMAMEVERRRGAELRSALEAIRPFTQ